MLLAGAQTGQSQGNTASPGFYELERLRVEHLRGVTHLEPPGISFEVKDTPEVVGGASDNGHAPHLVEMRCHELRVNGVLRGSTESVREPHP